MQTQFRFLRDPSTDREFTRSSFYAVVDVVLRRHLLPGVELKCVTHKTAPRFDIVGPAVSFKLLFLPDTGVEGFKEHPLCLMEIGKELESKRTGNITVIVKHLASLGMAREVNDIESFDMMMAALDDAQDELNGIGSRVCDFCFDLSETRLRKCKLCLDEGHPSRHFCNRICQVADWNLTHRAFHKDRALYERMVAEMRMMRMVRQEQINAEAAAAGRRV